MKTNRVPLTEKLPPPKDLSDEHINAVNTAREFARAFEMIADGIEQDNELPDTNRIEEMAQGTSEFFVELQRQPLTAPTESPKNLNDIVQELAAGLRDVIQAVPEDALKNGDPEEVYTDLACKLIFRISKTITIVPTTEISKTQVYNSQADAAFRIFDILTRWLREHPKMSYRTEINDSGKFEMTVLKMFESSILLRRYAFAYFQGESVQDAYAQAAHTINFNGGTL